MQGTCDNRIFKDMFSDTKVGSKENFARSKGWFEKFMVHHDLETKSYVTVVPKKEPLDPAAPVLYLPQLQKMTEEKDDISTLILGAVETHALKALNNPTCLLEEQEPTDADVRSAKTERLTFLVFCQYSR